jgi:ADP-heptose:LPS heptosyltransferase
MEIHEIKKYTNLLDIEPNNINYLYKLGNIYEKQNLFMKAIIDCYIKIIKIEPNNIIILNQIGICYFNSSQNKLAIHYFNKVLKIKELPDVYCNIGKCYINLIDYKLAETNFLKAYNLNNNFIISLISLGQLYYYIKNYDKSILFNKKALNNKENTIDTINQVKYSLAFSYLAKKEFKIGFELYETRLLNNDINIQTGLKERVDIPSLKFWNGIDKCNNLLIIYEQGIGDNIQYYRFIIKLSYLYPNMKITYFCKSIVSHIFKEYPNITIMCDDINLNNYDYKAFIMSLPSLLKIETILPNTENYININNNKLKYWENKFLQFKKLKVGFVYNGLLNSFIQKNIPLQEFNILSDLNIDLICLHKKDEIIEDINKIEFKNKINYYDIDNNKSFEDTICILKNLDLLITIDTSIVHLAGILNVKTWLLLGYSEWRWSNKNTTYWYNSVELIRNKENTEFKNILQIVKSKLTDILHT